MIELPHISSSIPSFDPVPAGYLGYAANEMNAALTDISIGSLARRWRHWVEDDVHDANLWDQLSTELARLGGRSDLRLLFSGAHLCETIIQADSLPAWNNTNDWIEKILADDEERGGTAFSFWNTLSGILTAAMNNMPHPEYPELDEAYMLLEVNQIQADRFDNRVLEQNSFLRLVLTDVARCHGLVVIIPWRQGGAGAGVGTQIQHRPFAIGPIALAELPMLYNSWNLSDTSLLLTVWAIMWRAMESHARQCMDAWFPRQDRSYDDARSEEITPIRTPLTSTRMSGQHVGVELGWSDDYGWVVSDWSTASRWSSTSAAADWRVANQPPFPLVAYFRGTGTSSGFDAFQQDLEEQEDLEGVARFLSRANKTAEITMYEILPNRMLEIPNFGNPAGTESMIGIEEFNNKIAATLSNWHHDWPIDFAVKVDPTRAISWDPSRLLVPFGYNLGAEGGRIESGNYRILPRNRQFWDLVKSRTINVLDDEWISFFLDNAELNRYEIREIDPGSRGPANFDSLGRVVFVTPSQKLAELWLLAHANDYQYGVALVDIVTETIQWDPYEITDYEGNKVEE